MADTGILATTQQILDLAGVDVSSVASAEAFTNRYVLLAENFLNSAVTFDFSANFGSLSDQVKSIVSLFVSAMAGNMVINYDQDAVGRSTAISRQNVNKDLMNMSLGILKNKSKQSFIRKDT